MCVGAAAGDAPAAATSAEAAEDGAAVAEVCRKAGISEATLYNWRKNYAGLMPSGDEAAASARGRVLIEKGLLLWNKAT